MAEARKPRLQTGDVVGGRYRIDGVVGRGGFGAVYRASHLTTGAQVALKVLLKNFSTSKVDSKRFKREASLVQKLCHPNVVQLLDFGQTEKGQPFIAFELLQGKALAGVLRMTGALPLWHVGEIARDVLRALEAAHQLGIVHRDIKPANVFMCEGEGGAKVLDFGIAKAVTGEEAGATQLTEAGQMIGTPHYMAPEQVRGTGVGPPTDLYALGLLMAEMVDGERVVKGDALIDIYMIHISDKPVELAPAVRESALSGIIERATEKQVEKRYRSATEMLADVMAVLPGLARGSAGRDVSTAGTMQMRQVPEASSEPPASDDAAYTQLAASPQAPRASQTGTVQMAMPDFERHAAAAQRDADLSEPPLLEHDPLEATADMIDEAPGEDSGAPSQQDDWSQQRTSQMAARRSAPELSLVHSSTVPSPHDSHPGGPISYDANARASFGPPVSGAHPLPGPGSAQLPSSADPMAYSGEHRRYSGEHALLPVPTAAPSRRTPFWVIPTIVVASIGVVLLVLVLFLV